MTETPPPPPHLPEDLDPPLYVMGKALKAGRKKGYRQQSLPLPAHLLKQKGYKRYKVDRF